jgi:uncharacterized protein YjgD (DUF1641 family)
MAQPIAFDVPVRDAKKELIAKLEAAPAEHVEAMLDLYALVQSLHEHRVFETARGVLGAGAKIVQHAAAAAEEPEAVAAMRNLIILGKMMSSINPELLQCFAVAVEETLGSERKAPVVEPPGLLSLVSQFRQPELRRSMALINRFLDVLGRQLKERGEAGTAS